MILNCLLINTESIEFTLQTLSVEAFYFKNHQEIYKAIILCIKINYRLIF
jgi:replicative DNA helicase